jgi:hypothetical protein
MARRMFANDPPRLTFTKDFRQLVHGNLQPGQAVTVVYDAERLPDERSQKQGQKGWTIRAYYKFLEQGEVRATDLWSETGNVLSKDSSDPGEGTMMIGRIDLPPGADHLTLWFLNTGKSGAKYWDSNFGNNYTFRFVVDDLEIAFARVVHDANDPLSWFEMEILALPEVYDLVVIYRSINDPVQARKDDRLALTPAGSVDAQGKRKWLGRTSVPETAVVRFALAYKAYGNPHVDTNSSKGYYTWAGAKRNLEAGVL